MAPLHPALPLVAAPRADAWPPAAPPPFAAAATRAASVVAIDGTAAPRVGGSVAIGFSVRQPVRKWSERSCPPTVDQARCVPLDGAVCVCEMAPREAPKKSCSVLKRFTWWYDSRARGAGYNKD